MEFCFFQNNSVENSLICHRTKSASHCLTELFSIYQNKHGTIRRRDGHIVVQSSHRNIFEIDGLLISLLFNQLIKYNSPYVTFITAIFKNFPEIFFPESKVALGKNLLVDITLLEFFMNQQATYKWAWVFVDSCVRLKSFSRGLRLKIQMRLMSGVQ